MTMAESTVARPVANYAPERRRAVAPTNVCSAGAELNTIAAHSIKAATLAAYVATTSPPLAVPAATELKATSRRHVEYSEPPLKKNFGAEEESALAVAQEKLRQQRQVELLQRQQELGRRLLVLQEQQRQRDEAADEAAFVGVDEWRWVTSTASDADEEDEYSTSNAHTFAPSSNGSCCTSGLKEPFKEEQQRAASVVADSEYPPQSASFSNVAVVETSSHSAAAAGEMRGLVPLHSKEPQSGQQVYSEFAVSRAGPAAVSAVYVATVPDTSGAAAAAAPVSEGSSGLSFPHLLWQEDEDGEAGEEVRAEPGPQDENERTGSAAAGPPLERAAAAGAAVPASQRRSCDTRQQQRIRYPFPEAAVLWESSSSCCSDNASVTCLVDEAERQQQVTQLHYRPQQHDQSQQQEDWLQQQRAQLQSVLGAGSSAATVTSNEWRDDAATQLAQSCSSSFSFQGKTRNEPASSGDCNRGALITRPDAVPVAEPVNVACITVGCRRTRTDASGKEEETNAGDNFSCKTAAAATPVDKGSSTADADAGTAGVSTAAASSCSSTPFLLASNQKRCAAAEGGTADAVPNSRRSPVIYGAAEHISTEKLSKLLQGRRVLPPRAAAVAGEAAERRGHLLEQPPTRPASSPRTIVPLHRHWVQQLLLQQKKQQQRLQRLQQQQRLRQQRESQSVQAQQQQHVRKQQQQVQHISQQHVARDQQHQQPRRRDRVLPQMKMNEQRGEGGQSLSPKRSSQAKYIRVAPAEGSKLLRGRGKASATGTRPSEAAAASCAHGKCAGDTDIPVTSTSATHLALPTDNSAATAPIATSAAAWNSAAASPGALVALSVASRNTAPRIAPAADAAPPADTAPTAATAPPAVTVPPAVTAPAAVAPTAANSRISLPVGASAAADGLACPAGLPAAAAAAGAYAPPPFDTMKSRLDCRDASFAAVEDLSSRKAAVDFFLRAAAPEAHCSSKPSSFVAASATALRSTSKTPPLPHSSVPNQCTLSTTSESLRRVHASTCAAAATTIYHNGQQWHLLDESMRLLNIPLVLPPAGATAAGAAFAPAKDVVGSGAATGGFRLPVSAAACTSAADVVTAPVKTATERKDNTKSLLDSQAFSVSNLNSSSLSLKDSAGGLQQSVATRRRSNTAAAATAAVAAQQPTDVRRKHASAAASRIAASATAASAAGVATGASREKDMAVSAPAGGNRGRTETSNRKSSFCRSSNELSADRRISGGEEQFSRKKSVSLRMAGEGGHIKNKKEEAPSAAQAAQRRCATVGEEQQQRQKGRVQQCQQGGGGLIVRGLRVTKQKTGSAQEVQQQQQQCVLNEGLQRGGARDNEKTGGEHMQQQQLFGDNDGDDVLKLQATLQKLRKRLMLDVSETDSQFEVAQQGKHGIICSPESSNHHDKSSSNRQLQQHCSRRNSHCGTASRKTQGAEAKGHLSRSSNGLSRSALCWRSRKEAAASHYKEGRNTRETTAAALKETRSVFTRDRTSIEKEPPDESIAGRAETAKKSLEEKTSSAAVSRDRLQQVLTASIDSDAGQQTDEHRLKQQQEERLQQLRQDKRKENARRKEKSRSSHWMTHVPFRGERRDAGVSVGTESVEGDIRLCSSSVSSRHSSRSRDSNSSKTSCTPSTILRRLRRLLQKDSSSSCVSPEYRLGRLNRRRKNQRQQKGKTQGGSSRCGSKSSAGDQSSKSTTRKSRSFKIRRKTNHSRNTRRDRSSSMWRDRNSHTRGLDSTSSSDTTSHRRGSSRGSSSCREITQASRRMWEKLVTQSRGRLWTGSSKATSSGYDTSVSSSRRCRRSRGTSNTDGRREMSSCSELTSSSKVSSSRSEVSSSSSNELSSNNSEVNGGNGETSNDSSSCEVSGSSKVSSSILGRTNAEESKHGFLEPLKKRRYLKKKRNARAARSYLADAVGAAACCGGHRSRPAAVGGAGEAAASPLAADAADAPDVTLNPREEKESPPSLISLWLQYSAAALEDTRQQQRRLLPSAGTLQQQLEGKLQRSDVLLQQVKTSGSHARPRRRSRNKGTQSRDHRNSSSRASSRSRSNDSALHSSSPEGSVSDSSSTGETPNLSRCHPSDDDTSSLCLDPDVIIRRIKRRLRLPLLPRLKDQTQRRQERDSCKRSINSSNCGPQDKSKKQLWGHAEQPRQLPQPQPRRQRQQEQQQKESKQQQAQEIRETSKDRSAGAFERKEDFVDKEQQESEDTSGRRSCHEQECTRGEVAPLLQEQGQRCTEAAGDDRQTDTSITDDDPSGPLHLSALGSPTVSPPRRLREAKPPQQQQQQEREDDKKQENAFCEKQEQRVQQPSKQRGDQQEHVPQELQRLLLKGDEQRNTLFCPTAATAGEDAASDLKEATATSDTKLKSSLLAVTSAENGRSDFPAVMQPKKTSPLAVSPVAHAGEISLHEDRHAAAAPADVPSDESRGKEQGHRDGDNKGISAVDASRAERRPSGHQPHLKTEQHQEQTDGQEKEAPARQTEVVQQKVQQKQKYEEMHQQQVQQSARQEHSLYQERKQQVSRAVANEKMVGKNERSYIPLQFEVISKQQPLPNNSSYSDILSEQLQSSPNEEAPSVAVVSATAAVESSGPAALMHAASALPAAATGAFSATASRVFDGGDSSPDAAVTVVTAEVQTSSFSAMPAEAAAVHADAAGGESRTVAYPDTVIAKAGYPGTMRPAAAADEAEARATGDAFSNSGAYSTPVERAAMLTTSNREQQAMVAAAGGGSAWPPTAITATTEALASVRPASSVGSFSFSLSSSSGSSSAADYAIGKLKRSSNSSILDKSNGRSLPKSNSSSLPKSNSSILHENNSSNRNMSIDAADNDCFRNTADNSILDGKERQHWRNEIDSRASREKHASPCENPAARLTAAGGRLALTSADDGSATAGTAAAAGAAEAEKTGTSVDFPAAGGIDESPCTSKVAEVRTDSSNEIAATDTKAKAVATPARPASARSEEVESGQHALQSDCYTGARESSSSTTRMQQPPQLFYSTCNRPRIKEGDTSCKEDRSLSSRKGEIENIFPAACAAAASGVSDRLAIATPAAIRASCPAAHPSTSAAASCPKEETVKARAARRSLVERTATLQVKKQEPPQPEAFRSHEMVLTREAPPPEVLALLVQQQRLLQTSTKHFRLPANRVSCDSSSSIAEGESWWLSLLSRTETLKPTGAPQEEVPEQQADQQTSQQEQQKSKSFRRRRKNDKIQQQTLRHGKSGGGATADERAALEVGEEDKNHQNAERQVINLVSGRDNQAGKVFAYFGETGEDSTVEQLGCGIRAAISSNSIVTGDKGVAAVNRPYRATRTGSRLYTKNPERVDSVAIAEIPTDVSDAVLASGAPVRRAACWKEEKFVVAALTELQQLLRRREEFSWLRGTDVLVQPFGPTNSSYSKEAERSRTQEQLQANARGDTNSKKSNMHSPAGGGTGKSRVAIDPLEEAKAREKSHLSKNASLGECDLASAAATERKKGEDTASRCHCVKGIRRATATTAKADGEEMQTSLIRRRFHRDTAGCSRCSPSQTEEQSPLAAAVDCSTKREERVKQHARKVLRHTSCRRRSSRLDSGSQRREPSHSSVNSDETKNMQKSPDTSNTSQRNSGNKTKQGDNRNICHDRCASETWPRYGCNCTTAEPGGKSRKVGRSRRRRCCFPSRDASGCESADCRERTDENSETSSDSTSSCSSRSSCCSSEERTVEENGSALKQQRHAHRGTLNKDNNKSRSVPWLQPQHCRERHSHQREHHKQQQRQHSDRQLDADVGKARAHRSEKQFNVVTGRYMGQCCIHDLMPQPRQMAWSCTRRSRGTSSEHSVHQQTSGSVSVSPLFKGKKTRYFLPSKEQQPQFPPSVPQGRQELAQGVKQETAQLPLGQIERMPPEQPDFAWCWREWGGCEIYEQQRNRLQAVLREALEGLA